MKIISFDQATKNTGYAVYNGVSLVDWGTISSASGERNPLERMKQMYITICKLLDAAKPDLVSIEGVEYRNNLKTYGQLANLQGVFFSAFFDRNIPFDVLQASKWRKTVGLNSTRKREEQKEAAIKKVESLYGITVNDDVAEAILQGLAAVKIHSNERDELNAEKEE